MAAGIHRRGILLRGILHSRGMGDLHRYVFDGDVVFWGVVFGGAVVEGQLAKDGDGNKKNEALTKSCRCNTAPRLPPRNQTTARKDVWLQCEYSLLFGSFPFHPFKVFSRCFIISLGKRLA